MRRAAIVAAALFLTTTTPATVLAQAPNKQKTAEIRRLLVASGAGELGTLVLQQLVGQFRQMFPKVPADFWTEFVKSVKTDALIELLVPIYDRHFSQADVRALVKFYESPVGRKLVKQLPQVTKESMAAGQAWGEQLGRQVAERLKKTGQLK